MNQKVIGNHQAWLCPELSAESVWRSTFALNLSVHCHMHRALDEHYLHLELKAIWGAQDEDAGDCEGVEQLHAG